MGEEDVEGVFMPPGGGSGAPAPPGGGVFIGSRTPVDGPGVGSTGGTSALNFRGWVAAVPVVPVTGMGGIDI